MLLVSLFLDWYEPDHTAWTVFETWDIVLAALCLAALVAVAARTGVGPPRPDSWLLLPAAVALVIVVVSLLDHPPAARGYANDPAAGIWLALAASVLMLAGALLSVTRISVAVNVGGPTAETTPTRGRVDPEPRAAAPPPGPAPGPGHGVTGDPRTEPTRPADDPLR
jgi:hypothetical protein